jgi:type I restriction enzyme S subunit
VNIEYPMSALGELAEFQEGYVNPKQSIAEYFDGDVKWLRAVDLNNSFVHKTSRTLTQRGYESAGKSAFLFPPETLAISKSGTIGRVGIIKDWMCGNRAVINVRPNPAQVDVRFIFYCLITGRPEIERLAEGSVQKNLYVSQLSKFEVPTPCLEDQKAIAHILGTLDDKIELNQKMNQTLEDIAKAIFKSWFVHFDPVRAKAEGRPTGLPADISDLFPDNLVDSEIGEIPAGWSLKTIGDIADCVGGGTPSTKSPEFWDNGIHAWTTPKDLSNSRSIHLMQTDRKITDLGLKKISSGLLPTGTVLLSSRAPVGYLALATEPTAINQGYIALRPKGTVSNYYLLHWCDTNLSEIKSRASGTTFAEISKASFRPIPALAPHDDVMSAFHRIVSPIYERVHISSKETQLLEDLRDTLLPKLISGELRIPDAKKFLEEAGI